MISLSTLRFKCSSRFSTVSSASLNLPMVSAGVLAGPVAATERNATQGRQASAMTMRRQLQCIEVAVVHTISASLVGFAARLWTPGFLHVRCGGGAGSAFFLFPKRFIPTPSSFAGSALGRLSSKKPRFAKRRRAAWLAASGRCWRLRHPAGVKARRVGVYLKASRVLFLLVAIYPDTEYLKSQPIYRIQSKGKKIVC